MFHLSQITDGNRTRVESVKEAVKSIGLAVREHLGLRALISESVATGFHLNKVRIGSGSDRALAPPRTSVHTSGDRRKTKSEPAAVTTAMLNPTVETG